MNLSIKNILKAATVLIGIMVAFSCQEKAATPKISFYYWKTIFDLQAPEIASLKENQVEKLYVRYFDIGLKELKSGQKMAMPYAAIKFKNDLPLPLEIVPVVFIKNEVMLSKKIPTDSLAMQTLKMIENINKSIGISVTEIQLDCDWSIFSQIRFNQYLSKLKELSNYKLSTTIRLHQIKHHNSLGIPYTDEGVLKFYNMGKINGDTLNSIYDRDIASMYIKSLQYYPLKLNVALPIYSWALQIRDGNVIKLISKVENGSVLNDKSLKKISKHQYEFKEGRIMFGNYFKKGDIIKIEQIKTKDLMEMAGDLKDYLKEVPEEVIFFDLDAINFNNSDYDKDVFKKVAAALAGH